MADKKQTEKTKKSAAKITETKSAAKKPVVKKAAPVKSKDKQSVKSDSKKVVEKKTVKKERYIPSYKKLYKDNIIKNLMKRFKYSSPMQVPAIEKITLNMGIGDAKNNPKSLENAARELTLIAGQKAVVTLAKKDISNFKIRRGFPVGCTVNLRANRMYEFLERLNSIALPRTRDFTGLPFKSFDGRGNYNFGVKEQIIFTEIDYDKIDAIRGFDIAIITSAKTDDEAYWLLKEFGFPLREKPQKQAQEAVTEAE